MFLLLLVATLAQLPTAVLSQAPLPVIEDRGCRLVDRAGDQLQEEVIVLRNVHTAPLVAWTLGWKSAGQLTVTSTRTTDYLFSPSLRVRPGATATSVSTSKGGCDRTVEIVAAHYADGSTAGDVVDLNKLFEIRQERVNQVEVLLSVLRTTHLAEAGVSGRSDVVLLLNQIDDSRVARSKGTVFEILSESSGIQHLTNAAGKKQSVSKATLIKAIEDGVTAARSVLLKAGR